MMLLLVCLMLFAAVHWLVRFALLLAFTVLCFWLIAVDLGHLPLRFVDWPLVVGHWALVIDHLSLLVGDWSLVIGD